MTNEENLQAHVVNISEHEDVIEDMHEHDIVCNRDEEECPARHVGILDVTPRGSKYWISDVEDKPVEGTIFESIQHAYQVYKEYATKGWFEIKRGGQHNDVRVRGLKKAKTKYFYCVREGRKARKPIVKETNPNNEKKQRRRRSSCRIGCQAKLVIKLISRNQYVVDKFVQRHNHYLVAKENLQFLRSCRKLTFSQKVLIHQISSLNMGPVRVFKLMKEMYGGFENIGATATDCKNERRDMNVFVGEGDAQMAVDKLLKAKRNYLCFGDVVSFDVTYRSNKYNMVLVPFIGIDNHNRCVTFGVGLIARETSKSYKWLLKSFKQAFRRAPKVFVTDQDAAIKKAIAKRFPNTRHRLCMWHIMKKLTSKVGPAICSNNSFKRQICDIVWTDKIGPEVFEEKWASIMTKFNLQENKWLNDMYQMKDKWILAYLRDEPMAGLMRTSSRYMHRKNDHDTMYTTPDLSTNLQIEKEAAELYTSTILLDRFVIHDLVDDVIANHVSDVEKNEINYEVEYNKINGSVTCSSKRFESYGILCRHIFYVLRMMKINEFPKKYLLRRWLRDALPPILEESLNKMREYNNSVQNVVASTIREIYSLVEYCINRLVTNVDALNSYCDQQKSLMTKADVDVPIPQEMDKEEMYSSALGVTKPKKLKLNVSAVFVIKELHGNGFPLLVKLAPVDHLNENDDAVTVNYQVMILGSAPQRRKKTKLAKEAESARLGTQPKETLNE
ncbi:FAR1-related sequence 5-like protein [Tanacetum coccineum]